MSYAYDFCVAILRFRFAPFPLLVRYVWCTIISTVVFCLHCWLQVTEYCLQYCLQYFATMTVMMRLFCFLVFSTRQFSANGEHFYTSTQCFNKCKVGVLTHRCDARRRTRRGRAWTAATGRERPAPTGRLVNRAAAGGLNDLDLLRFCFLHTSDDAIDPGFLVALICCTQIME